MDPNKIIYYNTGAPTEREIKKIIYYNTGAPTEREITKIMRGDTKIWPEEPNDGFEYYDIEFDGTSYIDTGVKLLSDEWKAKDWTLEFEYDASSVDRTFVIDGYKVFFGINYSTVNVDRWFVGNSWTSGEYGTQGWYYFYGTTGNGFPSHASGILKMRIIHYADSNTATVVVFNADGSERWERGNLNIYSTTLKDETLKLGGCRNRDTGVDYFSKYHLVSMKLKTSWDIEIISKWISSTNTMIFNNYKPMSEAELSRPYTLDFELTRLIVTPDELSNGIMLFTTGEESSTISDSSVCFYSPSDGSYSLNIGTNKSNYGTWSMNDIVTVRLRRDTKQRIWWEVLRNGRRSQSNAYTARSTTNMPMCIGCILDSDGNISLDNGEFVLNHFRFRWDD